MIQVLIWELENACDWQIVSHPRNKTTNKQKNICMGRLVKATPGSWPARVPKNPVVPTTVKRKAACVTEQNQLNIHIETSFQALRQKPNKMVMLQKMELDTSVIEVTSFLVLGIARFSAFFSPKVVSSRRDVCNGNGNF